MLRDLRIRFTQVSALNDPFESYPGILIGSREWYLQVFRAKVTREMEQAGLRSEAKRKQYWRARKHEFEYFHRCYTDVKWLIEQSDNVQRMSDTVHGCLSLSATAANILMWSHYAEHHKGYILGFHAKHDYFGQSVQQVVYSAERPPHNPFEHEHSGRLFYTKSADWAYEQEYRKYQSFVNPIKLQNGDSFLPYTDTDASLGGNKKIVLFPIPADSISCVVLGWKATDALKEAVSSALQAHGLIEVPFLKAQPSLTKYEMELVPCEAT